MFLSHALLSVGRLACKQKASDELVCDATVWATGLVVSDLDLSDDFDVGQVGSVSGEIRTCAELLRNSKSILICFPTRNFAEPDVMLACESIGASNVTVLPINAVNEALTALAIEAIGGILFKTSTAPKSEDKCRLA